MNDAPSDAGGSFREVMDDARRGSADAAERLVKEYGPVIRQVVRRRLDPRIRSSFDSIDFEQMVWASVFRSDARLVEFDSPRDFCRFLAAVARNKVISERRRRATTRGGGSRECVWDTEQVEAVRSREPTPSQVAQARELASHVLGGHSEKHRRIMQMRMQGIAYREIAEQVGLDIRTVRRTVARISQARLRKPGGA